MIRKLRKICKRRIPILRIYSLSPITNLLITTHCIPVPNKFYIHAVLQIESTIIHENFPRKEDIRLSSLLLTTTSSDQVQRILRIPMTQVVFRTQPKKRPNLEMVFWEKGPEKVGRKPIWRLVWHLADVYIYDLLNLPPPTCNLHIPTFGRASQKPWPKVFHRGIPYVSDMSALVKVLCQHDARNIGAMFCEKGSWSIGERLV